MDRDGRVAAAAGHRTARRLAHPWDAHAPRVHWAAAAVTCIAVAGCATARPVTTPSVGAPELYARVAPSVAYIETSLGSGTGVLVWPDRLVTNAHVVWPYEEVRVAFPDGTEIEAAPVVAQDLMADLAVVDLGDAAPGGAPVLRPAAGAGPAIGSDVYLVGYPAEVELFPQPAITRGILSRRRTWETADLTFLQTDADIAGGQSGGALLDADGRLIGFSSMMFGDSDFALAADAAASLDRLERSLAGEDVDGIDPRPLPAGAGRREQRAHLDGRFAEAVFVLDAPYGAHVDLSARSSADVELLALSPYGDLDLELDETATGTESGEVTVLESGPYFVVAEADGPADVTLSSSAPLLRLDDPDDGRSLALGNEVVGLLDYPGDRDAFVLRVGRRTVVELVLDTINFAPDLTAWQGDAEDPEAEGMAGGSLATTSTLELDARPGVAYVVRVADLDAVGTGAYTLEVRAVD